VPALSRLDDPEAGRRIHLRLSESLAHLADTGGFAPATRTSALLALSGRIAEGGTLAPCRFADYFALVRHIQADDRRRATGAARRLVAEGALADAGIAIRPLADSQFRPAAQRAVRRDFASDSLWARQIGRVADARVPETIERIEDALELCRLHAPQSYRTLHAVTREVIPVRGRVRDGMTFDGCSSVERWGAILVNMRQERTPLALAEVLVHESSHSYLFDLSHDTRLTLNPADELHQSPLRVDPRPIDGIFHACFVLSRMYAFQHEVAASARAPDALRQEAEGLAERRRAAFNDGYSVLEAHADLTPTGQAILTNARAIVPA